ncbi:MAG: protein TolR [Gammaproteobacteria bacterium]|nr:protein TolR [Gammaproteobacteria bacterium]MCW8910394.1 protein TolR [Gammaproteobacteria bacterium]MCW9004618.1 protein TolR [Gammaproteobacteria bacterium]MCW9056669.1 protein TolR [Gammaproteobacteria bacterium]
MSEINVVPYIDVMLVLLIIFMITAPLIQQGVEIDLPQASANPLPPDQDEPVVVSVDKKGDFYLDIGDQPDKPIDAQLLVNRVAAVRQLKPNVPVLVRGDRNVGYGSIIDAMVLLQKAGIEKVGLMTDQPEQ